MQCTNVALWGYSHQSKIVARKLENVSSTLCLYLAAYPGAELQTANAATKVTGYCKVCQAS